MSLRVLLSPCWYTNHSIIQEESTTTESPSSASPFIYEISSGQLFIAAVFFLIIPTVAFVLLGGVQKVKKLLGYGVKGKGKYSRLDDLEQ